MQITINEQEKRNAPTRFVFAAADYERALAAVKPRGAGAAGDDAAGDDDAGDDNAAGDDE